MQGWKIKQLYFWQLETSECLDHYLNPAAGPEGGGRRTRKLRFNPGFLKTDRRYEPQQENIPEADNYEEQNDI